MYRDGGSQRKHAFTQAPSTHVPCGSGQWPPVPLFSLEEVTNSRLLPQGCFSGPPPTSAPGRYPILPVFRLKNFLGGAMLVFGSLASSELGQVMRVSISSPATQTDSACLTEAVEVT